MVTLQIILLGLVVIAAAFLCHLAVVNPIGMYLPIVRRFISLSTLGTTVLLLSLLIHASAATILAVNLSKDLAIAIMSLIGLVWGLFAYFLLQRFAGPMDRTGMVRNHPRRLPCVNIFLFASSALALGSTMGWYWSILPVFLWFILGLITAELAIRRRMRQSEGRINRQTAIFGINQYQGRGGLLSGNNYRYPFP